MAKSQEKRKQTGLQQHNLNYVAWTLDQVHTLPYLKQIIFSLVSVYVGFWGV